MLRAASHTLQNVRPIRVNFGRILYHPEAIMLGIDPVTGFILFSMRFEVRHKK